MDQTGLVRFWLDTSLILRLLTGEPPELARHALEVFRKAAAGEYVLAVHPLVVAEAFHTLHSFYRVPKGEAACALLALLDRQGLEVREKDVLFQALREAGQGGLSLVDAYLVFLAKGGRGKEGIATLDQGLVKGARREGILLLEAGLP